LSEQHLYPAFIRIIIPEVSINFGNILPANGNIQAPYEMQENQTKARQIYNTLERIWMVEIESIVTDVILEIVGSNIKS
jgi:hypothetical protein